MLNAHRIQEISGRIANARGRHLRPEVWATLAGETLFNGVAVDFARDLPPELPKILRNVLREGLVKDAAAEQVGRLVSHQLADLLINAQHPPDLVDLDDAHADMFVSDRQPLFPRA